MSADEDASDTSDTKASTEDDFFRDSTVNAEFQTPDWIWKPLADALDGFDLDPATQPDYPKIAENIYTPATDGLSQPWYGDVFVNWPYTRELNPKWTAKIEREAQKDRVDTITALGPVSPGTMWWHRNLRGADYYTLVGDPDPDESPRVEFNVADRIREATEKELDNNATFASVIYSYGDFPREYGEALRELGFALEAAFPFQGGDQR